MSGAAANSEYDVSDKINPYDFAVPNFGPPQSGWGRSPSFGSPSGAGLPGSPSLYRPGSGPQFPGAGRPGAPLPGSNNISPFNRPSVPGGLPGGRPVSTPFVEPGPPVPRTIPIDTIPRPINQPGMAPFNFPASHIPEQYRDPTGRDVPPDWRPNSVPLVYGGRGGAYYRVVGKYGIEFADGSSEEFTVDSLIPYNIYIPGPITNLRIFPASRDFNTTGSPGGYSMTSGFRGIEYSIGCLDGRVRFGWRSVFMGISFIEQGQKTHDGVPFPGYTKPGPSRPFSVAPVAEPPSPITEPEILPNPVIPSPFLPPGFEPYQPFPIPAIPSDPEYPEEDEEPLPNKDIPPPTPEKPPTPEPPKPDVPDTVPPATVPDTRPRTDPFPRVPLPAQPSPEPPPTPAEPDPDPKPPPLPNPVPDIEPLPITIPDPEIAPEPSIPIPYPPPYPGSNPTKDDPIPRPYPLPRPIPTDDLDFTPSPIPTPYPGPSPNPFPEPLPDTLPSPSPSPDPIPDGVPSPGPFPSPNPVPTPSTDPWNPPGPPNFPPPPYSPPGGIPPDDPPFIPPSDFIPDLPPPLPSFIPPTKMPSPFDPPDFRSTPSSPPGGGQCKDDACTISIEQKAGDAAQASKDTFNKLERFLERIEPTLQALDVGLLAIINQKLGPQVEGGISGKLEGMEKILKTVAGTVSGIAGKLGRVASWLHLDRALNVLTFATTVHNAAMLSRDLGQTLFMAISNVLAVIGIKDDEGSPLDLSKIIGSTVENLLKGVLGAENYKALNTAWKSANRIYQAASNLLFSIQSLRFSVIGALETIGGWNARIGNALRKWGTVGESAYSWMNPSPNFDNKFTTTIQNVSEAVSQVDSVASELLSAQETVTEMAKQSKELKDSLGLGTEKPETENKQQKDKATAAKTASASPDISKDDLKKPGGV